MILKKIGFLTLVILSISFSQTFGFNQKTTDKAQKSMVLVDTKTHESAFVQGVGNKKGTGALVNKKEGIILTSTYTTGRAMIANYDIVYYDGSQTQAKLIYYDPWIRCSYLKVDPKSIPLDVNEVEFSKKNPKVDEEIFVLDNYGGSSFSSQKGRITNINGIIGVMPQHSMNISMNTQVSSCESPIFNKKGKAIGLKYGTGATYAIGIHPEYIRYDLKFLKNGKVPVRKHIGIITEIYSLAKAVKVRQFPQNKLVEHVKKFGKSRTEAIQVFTTLKGTPAHGKLINGDIIWAINGQRVGPNLSEFDMIMNTSSKKEIELDILRNGKDLKLKIELYDLQKTKIKSMIKLGDVVFFRSDDFYSNGFGIQQGSLTAKKFSVGHNDYSGRWILNIGVAQIFKINNQIVNDIKSLLNLLPEVIKQKYYSLEAIVYMSSSVQGAGARYLEQLDMYYNSNSEAMLYNWDSNNNEWKPETLN